MTTPKPARLATHIIALNYFSIIFIICGLALVYTLGDSVPVGLIYFLCWLYLVPPLIARMLIIMFGRPRGIVSTESKTHTIWWWLFQLQLLFNRFPMLEELLRVIPGLYAIWLNLWGARVNLFSFWAPGVIVMDRYHLIIGKGVILGTGCLLSAHVLIKKGNGDMFLVVDSLVIEDDALIGVQATLAPGCHIHRSQIVPAQKLLKPYTEIREGKQTLTRSIDYR